MKRIAVIAVAVALGTGHFEAQSVVSEHSTVTVVVTPELLKGDGYLGEKMAMIGSDFPFARPVFGGPSGLPGNVPIYAVQVVQTLDGQIVAEGPADWRLRGFPVLLEMKLEKVGTKDRSTEVEYRGNNAVIKFRLDHQGGDRKSDLSPDEMLRPFVIAGPARGDAVRSYLTASYRLIASRVFTGALADISEPQRLALLELAHKETKGIGIAAESYKGNIYFAVDLPWDGNIYNDLRLNEGQRLAKITSERLLSMAKAFAAPLHDSPLIFGVKLHTLVFHRDFLKEPASSSTEETSIYAPTSLIRKFADADITNQEFIDGCIVIVNGNRVKVVLTGG